METQRIYAIVATLIFATERLLDCSELNEDDGREPETGKRMRAVRASLAQTKAAITSLDVPGLTPADEGTIAARLDDITTRLRNLEDLYDDLQGTNGELNELKRKIAEAFSEIGKTQGTCDHLKAEFVDQKLAEFASDPDFAEAVCNVIENMNVTLKTN